MKNLNETHLAVHTCWNSIKPTERESAILYVLQAIQEDRVINVNSEYFEEVKPFLRTWYFSKKGYLGIIGTPAAKSEIKRHIRCKSNLFLLWKTFRMLIIIALFYGYAYLAVDALVYATTMAWLPTENVSAAVLSFLIPVAIYAEIRIVQQMLFTPYCKSFGLKLV